MRNALILAIALAALSASALDTIQLVNKPSINGTFTSYEKEVFVFLSEDQLTTHKIPLREVKGITLDSSYDVNVVMEGKHEPKTYSFRGFQPPMFLLGNGNKTEQVIVFRVHSVTPTLEASMQMVKELGRVISMGEEVDIAAMQKKGFPAMVLFYMSDNAFSVKIDSYLSRLVTMSHNQIDYLKILIKTQPAAVLDQYKVTTLPQVWIYSRNGTLVKQLSGEFNPHDIDAALEEAQKTQ
jgi:hypothetical protein